MAKRYGVGGMFSSGSRSGRIVPFIDNSLLVLLGVGAAAAYAYFVVSKQGFPPQPGYFLPGVEALNPPPAAPPIGAGAAPPMAGPPMGPAAGAGGADFESSWAFAFPEDKMDTYPYVTARENSDGHWVQVNGSLIRKDVSIHPQGVAAAA